ncbi:alpha/beta hydrolase [Flavobacterium psychrotrophum]|uniref:alpha/beta hydrolase n=1 Tax=Flavobacterium psychrotrophum TaxID=2294119 RepID=UPI001968B8B2|nr:alpha/beta hydrolase-fold protein [Flavobacterium psychrotrophum]
MRILLLLLFTLTMQAQNETLTYLVREPKIKSAHPPVIFLLHGVGSNEKDLFSFADKLPDNYLIISARGPVTIGPGRYGWFHVDFTPDGPKPNFEEEAHSRKLLAAFIGQMQEKFNFDPKKALLCGFSQGGIMNYSIALTHPGLVKGIAIMSSRLLPEIKPLVPAADKLKGLNIFISHGTADQVLTVEYARTAKTYLQSLKLEPEYHEYAGAVHQINAQMFSDLLNWIEKQ